ncbi:MAG: histidine kinase, partial [Anaerolineae bacterium]|nr:histidine kinase [Anaerolineae bacterium]
MTPETTDRRPRRKGRFLRGLGAQLLLWTILPLAIVLVALSLAGIARHRQAMTRLIEERDRGWTTAEANRLAREIAQQAATLTRLAATLSASPVSPLPADPFAAGGLALLDAHGALRAASPAASPWATGDAARVAAARAAAVGKPQYETDLADPLSPRLLIAAATTDGNALVAALPVEALNLNDANLLTAGETHSVFLVLDQTGRRIYHRDPVGLLQDVGIFADLPPADSGSTYLRDRTGRELLASYARVEPPGWTLIMAEDVRGIAAMGMSEVEVLPLVLLFVAIVALLAVSLGMLNVVRPLQTLAQRAARVAWGDFDAIEQPLAGVQEIEDLRATLAQMAGRIRAYQSGMRDYLSAITQGQEAERNRLAHELHDVTIQGLIALKQRGQMALKALAHDPARAADRLRELNNLLDEEIAGLRRIIGDLRPIYLEDLGFVPGLEMLARQIEERYGVRVHYTVEGEVVRLAPDLELAAYRIVQQALDNVAAHARATNAWVTVSFAADALTLTVR